MTYLPKSHLKKYILFIQSLGRMIEESGFAHAKYAFRDTDPFMTNLSPSKIPEFCYKTNAGYIKSSTCIIAEVSFPSTGVGIELQIAEQYRIPIIVVYKKQNISKIKNKYYSLEDNGKYKLYTRTDGVSVVVYGLSSIKKEIQYKSYQDCICKLKRYLSNFICEHKG